MLAERIRIPHFRTARVIDEIRIDVDDAIRAVKHRARIVERDLQVGAALRH
jgi:hypothetical protein